MFGVVFDESSWVARLILTAGVLAVCSAVRWLLVYLNKHRSKDAEGLYHRHKIISYSVAFIAVILISTVWIGSMTDVGTFLGLLSAGLALALRDPLSNMAGWFIIVLKRPFKVGDRIEIKDVRGDVIDKAFFAFSLVEVGNWVHADQSTGRVVHVPNAWVFNHAVFNYTESFNYIWDEIEVNLTFESDWKKAKGLIEEIGCKHTNVFAEPAAEQIQHVGDDYLIVYRTFTCKVYTSLHESGVRLTLRFLTEVRKRRGVEEAIWESILEQFECEPDITFAYMTHRLVHTRTHSLPEPSAPTEQDQRTDRESDG